MKAVGLTQAGLGRAVGLSQQSIHALITRNKTGSKHLHVIAGALRTTPAFLVGEVDDPDSDGPDAADLSPEARELLECYLALDKRDREALLRHAMLLAGKAPPTREHPSKPGRRRGVDGHQP